MAKVSIPDYPDNSSKPLVDIRSAEDRDIEAYVKEDEKVVAEVSKKISEDKKIVTGEVVRKKKSLGRKFKDTFVSEDAGSVGDYLVFDVLVPALKDTLYNAVANSVSMFLFGSSRGPMTDSYSRRDYGAYSRPQKGAKTSYRGSESQYERRRDVLDYDEIEFNNIVDANKVCDRLMWRMKEYGVVTLADFYDLVGITPDFTYEKYGWYDFGNVLEPKRMYGGKYYIPLPRPVRID